jgi:hypothetical protein
MLLLSSASVSRKCVYAGERILDSSQKTTSTKVAEMILNSKVFYTWFLFEWMFDISIKLCFFSSSSGVK